MAQVLLKNIKKNFPGGVQAVQDINLEIEDREFFVLVGPSGCGKSTVLRLIAGLEIISEGEIFIGKRKVNDIPPKNRNIAMVFQNYALYPHMSVYENMAFGLKLKKYPKHEIDQRVQNASQILGLDRLLERKPKALSGGQRQRVALGRAIVRNPEVFLFDEPLSNLDAKLRVQMRTELKKLHEKLQATMIYVTHDQIEAMTMGDRIAVIRDGMLQQVDEPLNIYHYPKNKFIAGFIGTPPMNFFKARILKKDGGLWIDEGTFQLKLLPQHQEKLSSYNLPEVTVGIRPEDLYDKLYAVMPLPENTFKTYVDLVEPMGSEIYLHLNTGKNAFVVRVDPKSKIRSGEEIEAVVDLSKLHLFHSETEESLL